MLNNLPLCIFLSRARISVREEKTAQKKTQETKSDYKILWEGKVKQNAGGRSQTTREIEGIVGAQFLIPDIHRSI